MRKVDQVAEIVETTLQVNGYKTERVSNVGWMRDDAIIIKCDGKQIPITNMNTSGMEKEELIDRIEEWLKPFMSKR